jgi:glutamine---fructose-6-phosphate transaminase (isomerizing)
MTSNAKLGLHMEAEMAEQPAVLLRLSERFADIVSQVQAATTKPVPGVAFLARGSSDNAALLGRYVVELTSGLPTSLVAPSILTAYRGSTRGYAKWTVVALSQSGRTPEIVNLVRQFGAEAGATVIGITNEESSEFAATASVTVALEAGPELAVPATKTVTAQMLATVAAAAGVTADQSLAAGLPRLAERAAELIADSKAIEAVAERLAPYRRMVVVGRGLLYPAAKETALKLQETTGAMAHGFSTADFRHGPIAVCGPDAPAVLLAGSGPADHDTRELRQVLEERGTPTVLLGTGQGDDVGWAAGDGLTDCLLATIRGQQLALAMCRRLGIDPDQPTGLNKVTLTH